MSSKLKKLKKEKMEIGEHIGLLLPANWIELKGRFSPSELRTIATAVDNNFKKVGKANK